MKYEIIVAPEAIEDLDNLKANLRAQVVISLEQFLRYEPTKLSRSRIKRLRGLSHPQYRRRIGSDIRVFFDVQQNLVQVLAIVLKSKADSWLAEHGENDETDTPV